MGGKEKGRRRSDFTRADVLPPGLSTSSRKAPRLLPCNLPSPGSQWGGLREGAGMGTVLPQKNSSVPCKGEGHQPGAV